MDESRRYSEAEVEEIFERATDPDRLAESSASPGEGISLAELQEIGREAGISPEAVERAARSLERSPRTRARKERFLGLPIGVGRTLELPRRLTDEEWAHLVTDLRDTFSLRGKIRSEGPIRSWGIGNLRVRLEPHGKDGETLRFQTEKGGARGLIGVGAGMLGFVSLLWLLAFFTGDAMAVDDALTIGLVGAAFLGINVIRLPPWAGKRARQIEEVGARVLARIKAADSSDAAGSPDRHALESRRTLEDRQPPES